MNLTTVSNTKADIIATNGKLWFAKRHDKVLPWQILTKLERAQAWLERPSMPAVVRWN